MEIKKLIGETSEYDKKEQLEERKPKSWCKSISAFANGKGGFLIFGVDDQDYLVGLADAKKDSEKISEIIKTHLDPIPDFDIAFENEEGKAFLVVQIKAGNMKPYYYKKDGQLIAYIRVGNESVPADAIKLKELVLEGSGTTYDSLKSAYKFSNLSFTKLRSVYKNRTGKTFEDSDYESFGLIDENGNLTNAGALLADESPVRHSRLFCTRWNGLDKAGGLVDALDDREYSGSIITLLQSGVEFVTNHSMKAFKKLADRRVEYPEYPGRAVMEGLVNALIHRNYMEVGSEVHIDMYDDRLEIYSPGGMFSGKTLKEQDILSVPSKRRNPILADIFGRLNYMERRGSGFKKIISDYQFQENYTEKLAPVFDDSNGDFVLTLYNLNYNVPQDVPQDVRQDVPQDEIDRQIINMIRNNSKVTAEEIAKELNVTSKTINRRTKKMPNVHYVGSGYSGHWEIDE